MSYGSKTLCVVLSVVLSAGCQGPGVDSSRVRHLSEIPPGTIVGLKKGARRPAGFHKTTKPTTWREFSDSCGDIPPTAITGYPGGSAKPSRWIMKTVDGVRLKRGTILGLKEGALRPPGFSWAEMSDAHTWMGRR